MQKVSESGSFVWHKGCDKSQRDDHQCNQEVRTEEVLVVGRIQENRKWSWRIITR
jgi:hypothetical protein